MLGRPVMLLKFQNVSQTFYICAVLYIYMYDYICIYIINYWYIRYYIAYIYILCVCAHSYLKYTNKIYTMQIIHSGPPLWYTKTCTNSVFDTHFWETRVFSRSTMKRAYFFPSTFVSVFLVFLLDTTILISLVFELLKRCRECHVVPCMNKKTKVTCIGMHWSICQTVL